MKFSFVARFAAALAFVSMTVIAGAGGADMPASKTAPAVPVAVAEDLSVVLVTGDHQQGLAVVNTDSKKTIEITATPHTGYYATIAPSGNFVCYKDFVDDGRGGKLQVPSLFDIAAGKAIALSNPVSLAGVPAVAADGRVAFAIGNEIRLLGPDLKPLKTYRAGCYANLLAFSPDGRALAFADDSGQIVVMSLQSGAKRRITKQGHNYYGPQFSPKGDKILARTVDGQIVVASLAPQKLVSLGQGENPGWLDNETVGFVRKETMEGLAVIKTRLIHAPVNGKEATVAAVFDGAADAVVKGSSVAASTPAGLRYGVVRQGKAVLADVGAKVAFAPLAEDKASAATAVPGKMGVVDYGDRVQLSGVPYLHQVYDTPDWYNGHWACNASSALMALQYFSILPNRPINCSTPYAHQHNFGFYVPEIYSFNGYTYNIASPDPNGRNAWGAYGYIVRNNWADTKGYMRDWFVNHGAGSSVDWSPSMAKARTEINGNYPFVVLTSLTSAGHYITCIGAFKSQSTLVFNDPYGNKNSGYMNYSGIGVRYDWPGFNNGYANMNTVHCFIYCRLTQGVPWDAEYVGQSYPTAMFPGQQATMWIEYRNKGTQTWSSSGSNPTRLATSAPRGSTGVIYTAGDWPNVDRATNVDANTAPNAVGRFTFEGTAPTTPGYYKQVWELVTDGVSWFDGTGDDAWFGIEVAKSGDNVTFQCADYAHGADALQNTDYYDTTAGNTGGQYRNQDVDIRTCPEGGYQVGWTVAGEWLSYWWHYTQNGTFAATLRYSNGGASDAQVKLTLDGYDLVTLTLPPTGSYDTLANASGNFLVNNTGLRNLKLHVLSGNPDLKSIQIARVQTPAAPSGLTATAVSASQINLTWTDNSTNETNFVVARATTSGGPYTDIATLGANVTSYSNTGLSAGTTYYYVVRATNAAGSSANSAQASATTLPNPPAAPSGLTATAASSSQINLTWTDNSTNESNFVVARATTAGGPYTDIATLAANTTSFSNTGLSAATTYYYVVRATNAGGASANSAEASATTLPNPPAAPSGLTATAASSSQINLTWTDNSTNESNFVVARATTAGGPYTDIATLAANTTSFSNTGLSAATTYYYVVRATNAGGASANSAEASATTLPNPPAAPSGLTATAASSSQINLTWTDNSTNESNFVVARATTSGGPYTDIATLGANVTSFSNTGLSANTTYYYVVRATNAGGASANSNQASATTLPAVPAAPSGLTATAVSASQINLTWTDNSSNETNFVVARATTSGGPYTDIATLGANVTSFSNTGLSANTTYYYVVRATNAGGASGNSNQASALTWPAEIIIDNTSAQFSASSNWVTASSATDKYGADYRWRSAANGVHDPATFTWTAQQTRQYEVYAWWPQGTNRCSSTPFDISTQSGTVTVYRDQRTGGGQWQSLGTYTMNAGTNTVRVSVWTAASGVVMADAVRIVPR